MSWTHKISGGFGCAAAEVSACIRSLRFCLVAIVQGEVQAASETPVQLSLAGWRLVTGLRMTFPHLLDTSACREGIDTSGHRASALMRKVYCRCGCRNLYTGCSWLRVRSVAMMYGSTHAAGRQRSAVV